MTQMTIYKYSGYDETNTTDEIENMNSERRRTANAEYEDYFPRKDAHSLIHV